MVTELRQSLRLLLATAVLCLICAWPAWAKVVCNIDTYVLTSIEFSKCYETTLNSYDLSNPNFNPCPALHHSVYGCSDIIEPCYDHRGWHRERQVFLEMMSLQYPQHQDCDVFNNNNNNDTDPVPQKLDDELCSINEVVVMLQQVKTCCTNAQSEMVTSLIQPATPDLSLSNRDEQLFYFPTICKGLETISNKCLTADLLACYDAQESVFYKAYVLEELRMASTSLMTHLMIMTGNDTADDRSHRTMSSVINIDDCPVFVNSPLMKQKANAVKADMRVKVLVAALVVVFLIKIAAFSFYLVRKFRLMPRLRARLQNQPYEDIVIPERPPPPPATPTVSKSSLTDVIVANEVTMATSDGQSA